MKLDIDGGNLNHIQGIEHDYGLRGLWTELGVSVDFCDTSQVELSLGHLYPTRGKSDEVYRMLPDFPSVERPWSADIQWWQAEVRYSHQFGSVVRGLVGFRYDSFMTNFSNPSGEPTIGDIATAAEERADLSFNGYIPFVGIKACAQLPWGGSVNAALAWFPVVWGAFDYRENMGGAPIQASNEIRRGHMLEGTIEVAMPVSALNLSAFATYRSLRATTKGDATQQSVELFGEPYHNPFDFSFRREAWTWGGKVNFCF